VPVLVEAGEDHLMDMDDVERAITPRTRAILPVHMDGRVCDMSRLGTIARRQSLQIIEDAAQALGARFQGRMAGSFGLAGCVGLYRFKALGGFGHGGALTTNNPGFIIGRLFESRAEAEARGSLPAGGKD
jgi:dTDP-4-amino-4,6-dideoxygalactose transaminase